MSKLTFIFVCAEVLFSQLVFSQSYGYSQPQILNFGNSGSIGSNIVSSLPSLASNIGYSNLGSNLVSNVPAVVSSCSNVGYSNLGSNIVSSVPSLVSSSPVSELVGVGFGGSGQGQLAVVGDVPIGGDTYLSGNLPVIGLVEFNGNLPASGFVSVSGGTPCDCSKYSFNY